MIAVDLGSNTIRFLASDGEKIVYDKQFVVRTAEHLATTKQLSSEALKRIKNAILTAQSEFDFAGKKIRAVATEAFRQAQNQEEAVAFLYQNTGVKFEVISSDLEAKLTANAIRSSAKNHGLKEPFFIVDIGGASSEVIFVSGEQFDSISLPLGIVQVAEKNLSRQEMVIYLQKALKPLERFSYKPNLLIATAGTPTTLAAIKIGQNYNTYNKTDINGTKLDLMEIESLYQKLLRSKPSDLIELVGENRADLVIAGCVMLEEFIKKLGVDNCTVFDEGLREGVLELLKQEIKNKITSF